ncbi:RNA methyltransferase, partial [Staphylococcus aureus]
EKNEQPFFLILDELEDPHNLGSIMRTADAVGAHGIVIPKRRAVGLTTTVAKASTGAIEHIPVARVTNLARTLEEMKERGI